MQFRTNENLHTVLPTEKWKGTPTDKNGRFVNHEFAFDVKFGDVLKWKMKGNAQAKEKLNDKWIPPIAQDTDWLHNNKNCIVWLGHSTFFIRLNNTQIVTDPVFGNLSVLMKRASPFSINPNLLKNIDLLLLSHDHRDHLDKPSIQQFVKNNPTSTLLTGLDMDNILRQWNVKNELQTAGWYQKYNTAHTQVEVFFLPARHWSRRGLTDTNKRLWGSFLLQTNHTKIYFSGDTGYGSHLKEVKDLFGDIDYFICGIGAYKPEWFMHSNHISPKDALKAANEMQAKHFVPMHYGTFDLSDEPISEPIKELKIHGQNLQTNVLMPHLAQAIYF